MATQVARMPVMVDSQHRDHRCSTPLRDTTGTTSAIQQDTPPSTPPRRDLANDEDDSELSEIETPPRPAPKKMDVQQSTTQPTPKPAKKQQKTASGASSDPVQLKNGKLVLKQKGRDFTMEMSVLSGIMSLNALCSSSSSPLSSIPQEQLAIVARLTQENDKTLSDVAKFIKSKVLPTDSSSQSTSESQDANDILPLSVIESAIKQVAERINYGLEPSDVASSSKSIAEPQDIPAGLQLWRWEVKDTSLLQPERVQEMLARREERKEARQKALELFNAMTPAQRSDILIGKKKSTKAKAVPAKQPSPAAPQNVKNSGDSAQTTKSSSTSPAKSEAGSKADSGIVIIDDEDDDQADDEADEQQRTGKPSSSKSPRRASSSAEAVTSPGGSKSSKPKPQKRAKLETLTPAQVAERERKEQEKDEKRRAKEEKDAKKQKALEATKKSASILSGFFNKKAASPADSPKKPAATSPSQTATSSSKDASTVSDYERTFIPIAYKNLAPLNRFQHKADLEAVDQALKGASEPTFSKENALQQLVQSTTQGSQRRAQSNNRIGIHPPVNVRETMRLVAESDLMTEKDAAEQARKALESLKDRRKVPVKLLQFATDLRPGWYGTWTRPSNMISGRRPLRQDPVALDYNYDSEAEWVEGDDQENGEEVGDDNDEPEEAGSNVDDDSEMDDWLVDDLEEIEGEGGEADDGNSSDVMEVDPFGRPMSPITDPFKRRGSSPVAAFADGGAKRKRIPLPGLANKKKRQQKQKRVKNSRRFTQKLVPVTVGPHWQEELGRPAHPAFAGYQIKFLNGAYPGLDPFTFVDDSMTAFQPSAVDGPKEQSMITTAAPTSATTAAATADPTNASSKAKSTSTAAIVPMDHLPSVLQHIEGSKDTKAMLIEKLSLEFKSIKSVTRVAITATITQTCEKVGSKKTEQSWRVKDEFRDVAGLS
ncbi:unnamed protein product [Sympodiomycopsis kandeliae]